MHAARAPMREHVNNSHLRRYIQQRNGEVEEHNAMIRSHRAGVQHTSVVLSMDQGMQSPGSSTTASASICLHSSMGHASSTAGPSRMERMNAGFDEGGAARFNQLRQEHDQLVGAYRQLRQEYATLSEGKNQWEAMKQQMQGERVELIRRLESQQRQLELDNQIIQRLVAQPQQPVAVPAIPAPAAAANINQWPQAPDFNPPPQMHDVDDYKDDFRAEGENWDGPFLRPTTPDGWTSEKWQFYLDTGLEPLSAATPNHASTGLSSCHACSKDGVPLVHCTKRLLGGDGSLSKGDRTCQKSQSTHIICCHRRVHCTAAVSLQFFVRHALALLCALTMCAGAKVGDVLNHFARHNIGRTVLIADF